MKKIIKFGLISAGAVMIGKFLKDHVHVLIINDNEKNINEDNIDMDNDVVKNELKKDLLQKAEDETLKIASYLDELRQSVKASVYDADNTDENHSDKETENVDSNVENEEDDLNDKSTDALLNEKKNNSVNYDNEEKPNKDNYDGEAGKSNDNKNDVSESDEPTSAESNENKSEKAGLSESLDDEADYVKELMDKDM